MLAAIDERQEDYIAAREVVESARGPLLISPFVLAELDYMILTRMGRGYELALLGEVARGVYGLEYFSEDDVAEAVEIVERYADFRIGLADASNVVLANRHDTLDVLTLDERHFRTLRGPGGRPFRVLPADAG
ncbi:MAG TPA: VapC toxin family PIN domain ribonuclease [Rubrobacter sp.]|nr:VapC toxin family PIN domain ribonuclease [Rubrobacter sp.]